MDYDPSTGQAKAPRRGLAKSRRGFVHELKPPSKAQITKLIQVLGCEGPRGELLHVGMTGIESYVRFANFYHQGPLGSLHWMHAITLAISGENIYGTSEDLERLSEEPDGWLDPETGDALPLGSGKAWKRHFGGFKRRKSGHSGGSTTSRLFTSSGTRAPQYDHNMTATQELQSKRLLKVRELNMARVSRLKGPDDLKD